MPRPGHDEVLLVTGYPALVARQLVARVLREQPRSLVYVVVKPSLAEQASEHLASLDPQARQRVVVLAGDVAHMDFGLSGAEFRQLCNEVDRIHHTAQISYLGADRVLAQQVNVRGAIEALELARACKHLRAFVHYSTAFVSGDRSGVVRESELLVGQRFRNVIEETKATAEQLVRSAIGRLPILIVRPGLIVGDSQSGEVDRFDGPYLVVLLVLGSPPEMAIPLPPGGALLPMVPVDYLVQAAHHLARDGRSLGRTFHLLDPLPARHVFEQIARAGGRKTSNFLPLNLTSALFRAPGLERFARSPRAFFEQLVTPVHFDASNTTELLAGTSLACPPFESYVDQLVAYARGRTQEHHELFPPPATESGIDDPLP